MKATTIQFLPGLLTLLWLPCALNGAVATNTPALEDLFAPPKVTVRKIEPIKLADQQLASKKEASRIENLIKNLRNIESPDVGLSSTMSGTAFAPIPSMRKPEAFLMTNHHIKNSEDFLELVKLGPKALPFLLKALDDRTLTKLVIRHEFGFGAMWFANELSGNPGNKTEQTILASVPPNNFGFGDEGISSYPVKIGDVCFVIIGQIVARNYEAVRYQPTACIVINSPTHDAKLAQQVRDIWASNEQSQHLLDSLLLDYASEGVFNGRSLDGWSVGSSLQIGAAMRMLFYYPEQTRNLIAGRLHQLDVSAYDMQREVKNGVRTVDFIKATAWSKEPIIRAELQRIFKVTSDPEILQASVVAMDETDARAFQQRLEEFIFRLPETEPGPFGTGYNLLLTLGKQVGEKAKPAFVRYMQNASLQRRRSMCRVLLEVQGAWSIQLLSPLLNDRRKAEGWNYAVDPGQNEPRLPIRICDEAAETIAKNFPKLSFKMAGEHKDLDAQIELMKKQIAQKNY